MIHEIGVQLGQTLSSKGLGIPVVDGPERRPTTTFARERVVIERSGEDGYESRHLADKNPRTRMTRLIACKVTIYAQEPNKGAAEWEHFRRAEQMLDMVLIALDQIAKARQNLFKPKSGKFVVPDDMKHGETMGGAVYELQFTFDRGVADRNWNGSIQPTGSAAIIDTESIVQQNGTGDEVVP